MSLTSRLVDLTIRIATEFKTRATAVANSLATKEPNITAGTTSDYYRGDKTFQPLNKTAVGLGNVPNTDLTSAVALNTAKVTNANHTGDATGATALTLATVNSNIGTFGSNTNIPIVTVNAKGLVTAIATQAVSIPSGAISVTSSDITMSGTTGTAITNAVIVNNAITNSKLAQVPTKTFKGRTSAATGNVEDLTVAQVKTDLAINLVDNTSDVNKPISTAQQAALNLKADLVGGFVPANQLPSYVDDVLEFATLVNFPVTGESGKIYITADTSKVYRWSGSTYIEISGGASATVSARTVSTFTATALQTTFTLPLGYVAGLVDVFLNGVKLTGSEFDAINGTTIVLNEAAALGDIIDIHNFNTAITANNTLRLTNTYTATAGQTTFLAVYTPGLIDVFYNGSRLTASEYTATNGTSVVLATPSVLNDIVEILVYNFNVSGFSGLGGTGTNNRLPKFSSANSLTNSSIVDNGSTVVFSTPITVPSAIFNNSLQVSNLPNGAVYSNQGVLTTVSNLITATGGTITTSGNFRFHTFNSSGNFIVTSGSGTIEVFVLGGGGSGGGEQSGYSFYAGGGGAGGAIYNSSYLIENKTYQVIVGAGGTTNASGFGLNGSPSSFDNISALGGGGGGRGNADSSNPNSGGNGGCGGGGGSSNALGGIGIQPISNGVSFGNNGGNAAGAAGGGGGIGGSGTTPNGGLGRFIFNLPNRIGGGGGGGVFTSQGNTGRDGGGSGGFLTSDSGSSGAANTGGGGGGIGYELGSGGNGGSGVVIIRYKIS